MIKRLFRNEAGFTMVEMMVVLVIIAALIAGGIKFYLGYIENAKITKAKGQIGIMQAALDSYYAENAAYPDTTNELKYAGIIPNDQTTTNNDDILLADTKLSGSSDPWGVAYDYKTDTSGTKYCVSTGYDLVKGNNQVVGKGTTGTSVASEIGKDTLIGEDTLP